MSVLIGVGIATTITAIYLGRKGWKALHKAAGITPGVLEYHDYNAPLSLSKVSWQELKLNKKHLLGLPDHQLRQLQRIDKKVTSYQAYQKTQPDQEKTSAVTEQQFVLNKMLHTRLPEVLASHYNLATINSNTSNSTTQQTSREKKLRQVSCCNKY